MPLAYCKICYGNKELQAEFNPDTILVPLVCGHTYNSLDGECYTQEQMQDAVGILSRSINKFFVEARDKKRQAMKAVEDII